MLAQHFTTFTAGMVIAFTYSWKLTLIMMAVSPINAAVVTLSGRFMVKLTLKVRSKYAAAGAIAQEVISSIKTVAAFGGESKEMKR